MQTMRIFQSFLMSLAASLWLQSCSQPPEVVEPSRAPKQSKLILSGSSTLQPIVSEIAKRYQAGHPQVRIEIASPTDTWRGIVDTRQGIADIGLVSRELKADEQDLLAFTIAKDGISVIVHKDNPVKSLTNQQLADIYTDKINNWKQVGGKDARIVVISWVDKVPVLEIFASYLKVDKSVFRPDAIVSGVEEDNQAVAGNPNTISPVGVNNAKAAIARGVGVKLLPLNGVAPTVANFSNGTFPIIRPLNLVTKNPPSALAKDFIDFALSQEGQDILREQKVVPVK